ncbi:hypothetical protein C0J52_00270 [Blattella germanica]|nr:hypothetical protein C0J52_00270 [Blattella germanica]
MVEIIPFKAFKNFAVEVVKRCESSGKKKDRCESAHYFLLCIKNESLVFVVNMFTG